MALRALNNNEHSRLLLKVNNLSFAEEQSAKFEQQLTKFYEQYQTLLVELSVVIVSYREVDIAVLIAQLLGIDFKTPDGKLVPGILSKKLSE